MPWQHRLLNHGSARVDLVISTDDVFLGDELCDRLFDAEFAVVLQEILADRLADLRLQDPPRPRERPQEQRPPPREQQPAPPAPRTTADAGPEPETEEAPAELEGAVPPPGGPALPCPGASRGISQARIDRAWRIGKRAGDVLGGRERLHAQAEPMPADAAALRASCWVVALGYEEDTPRVTIHRYAHDTPAQVAGQRLVYQGYRSRIEGPAGLGRNAVFKGFPSLQEAQAYAAGMGVEPDRVPINPLA